METHTLVGKCFGWFVRSNEAAAMTSHVPTLIVESSAPYTRTVVFLHGRGDKAQNFAFSLTS
ncbi:uncharacterized protein DNG_02965 [Cephalotrichum gorgonifer]|uniref:Phospholipase/carboxylesterase/thioesterase domain-containing protein n=1 Tax=Cephalotrichum gorgonifer TaxID=2041049 RepID=A0AAE8MVE1_9PEZI|nr:uncharacterized protein DNG_02965 [Cephalotrichum gorgonifer]